ncbi:hypothetical protein NFJ02_03g104410 [Pycnococcus provasolii]
MAWNNRSGYLQQSSAANQSQPQVQVELLIRGSSGKTYPPSPQTCGPCTPTGTFKSSARWWWCSTCFDKFEKRQRGKESWGKVACAAHQQDDAESNPVVIDEEVPAELRRRRRTRNRVDAHDIDDASELEGMVVDKRARKRKNPSKARRRNRRYENRIARSLKGGTLDDLTTDDE